MKKNQLLVVGGVHGDEKIGIIVARTLGGILGNPEAIIQEKRYLETDLNRSFGVNIPISLEEKRASEIAQMVTTKEYMVDIHSTKAEDCTCAIVVIKPSKFHLNFARYFEMKRIVIMPPSGSLISLKPKTSISLEFSTNEIDNFLINKLINKIKNYKDIYIHKGQIKVFQYLTKITNTNLLRLGLNKTMFKNFQKLSQNLIKKIGLKTGHVYVPFFLKTNRDEEIAFTLLRQVVEGGDNK